MLSPCKNHLESATLSKTEISDANHRLKLKDPTATISVDDSAFIKGELSFDEMGSEDHEREDVVFSEKQQDDENSRYITEDDMTLTKSKEIRICNSAFMHGTFRQRSFQGSCNNDGWPFRRGNTIFQMRIYRNLRE